MRVSGSRLVLSFFLAAFALDVSAMRHPDAGDRPARKSTIKASATGGTINGRIIDETGAPVPDVYIWLAFTSTRQFAYESDQGVTGSDGVFTVTGIADGDYFINAYPNVPSSLNLDTWYPDVWDFDFHANLRAATPVRFSGGNTINLEMRLPRGTRFRFELRDANGQIVDITSQDPACAGYVNLGLMYADSGTTPLLYPITFNCLVFSKKSAGSYVTVPVPVGRKIWMELWPEGTDFLPVYHDGRRGSPGSPLTASSIGEVAVPVTLSARGPSIFGAGRFQSVTLQTILRRNIRLYNSAGQLVRIVGFGADGNAAVGGMPDGDYRMQYSVRGRNAPSPSVTYAKFYRNSSTLGSATPIPVRGADVTGINVLLDTPPDIAQVAGDWSGTYNDNIACGLTNFTSSGVATLSLTQSGTNVNGTGTLFERKNISGSCAASGTTTIVGSIAGALNGSAFTGTFATTLGNLPLSGTFGASTFSGTLTYANGTSALSLRSGSATRIESFLATPAKIRLGESATLTWKTSNALSVAISNVGTSLAPNGSADVRPAGTTTYTLTAGSSATPPTADVTVEVQALPAISIASLPDALLQLPDDAGATTTYTLLNSGGAASSIALEQSGAFFTQEPASFTLAAGASQTVTIRATRQEPGSYEGRSTIRGAGVPDGLSVPIRLLVSSPPSAGSATAETTASRVDVAAPPGDPQPAGSVSFSNSGTATLVGILSSDVPWILFPNPTVTIPPGQTVAVSFTIDRSLRPDGSAPIGSVVGTLRLAYPSSSAQGKVGVMNGGSVTSSTTVTIVDTAKPPTNAASLTKLAPGEVARFVPRVSHSLAGASANATDVTVARSVGSSTVSDLRLFYVPAGQPANASIATLGALLPNQSLFLGNIVSSIFGRQSETGSLQLRSVDWDKISLQARTINLASSRAGLGRDVPVFRSDRAAGAGENLHFTGLRRDVNTEATIYLQEASGNPAAVSIDYLDAAGTILGSRGSEAIAAFALLELQNIPIGTVTAVVRHSETSGGQIVGYASMTDAASGDNWNVTDWSRYFGYKSFDAVRVPLVESSPRRRRGGRPAAGGASASAVRTELAMFNPNSSSTAATLAFTDASGRTITKSVSVAPRGTVVVSDVVSYVGGNGRGSLVITPTGSLAIAAGVVAGGATPYSAAIPPLASTAGLRLGDSIAFSNLEDASARTVQARTPGTLRTGFGIVETGGKPVTVRAALTYADGSTPVAATLARDFVVGAGQTLTFDAIAAAIIGPSREISAGDLRQMRVSFQVISGEGHAIIFVRTTENATGDSIVRVE